MNSVGSEGDFASGVEDVFLAGFEAWGELGQVSLQTSRKHELSPISSGSPLAPVVCGNVPRTIASPGTVVRRAVVRLV